MVTLLQRLYDPLAILKFRGMRRSFAVLRQYVVTPKMQGRGFTCIMESANNPDRDYHKHEEVTTHV